MGCSYYFRGCLKDNKAQEEVIELVAQLAGDDVFMILPDKSINLAKILLDIHRLEDGSHMAIATA
ncbi:MAG: hypothetical protein ACOYL3_28695 [Desulfuromonadaceae bacterium]